MVREGRTPPAGQTISRAVARNIRAARAVEGLTQQGLADRMSQLGYPWLRATVSDVERNNRAVTVDELAAIALVVGWSLPDLLDPRKPSGVTDRSGGEPLVYGDLPPLQPAGAATWLRGDAVVQVQPDDKDDPWKVRHSPDALAADHDLASRESLARLHASMFDSEDDR